MYMHLAWQEKMKPRLGEQLVCCIDLHLLILVSKKKYAIFSLEMPFSIGSTLCDHLNAGMMSMTSPVMKLKLNIMVSIQSCKINVHQKGKAKSGNPLLSSQGSYLNRRAMTI